MEEEAMWLEGIDVIEKNLRTNFERKCGMGVGLILTRNLHRGGYERHEVVEENQLATKGQTKTATRGAAKGFPAAGTDAELEDEPDAEAPADRPRYRGG